MSLNNIEIGKNISIARKAAKMSQSKLASEIGIDQGYISRLENGMRSTNLEVIVSIANALETGVDDLLGSNLTVTKQVTASPIEKLFTDCTPKERSILTKLLVLMAEILIGHLK